MTGGRRSIWRALRALDDALGRVGGRRTVLIEARTPMNLAVLRPVFAPLLRDRRLRVRFTGNSHGGLRAEFEQLGVSDRVIPRDKVRWLRTDLYINADPWEAVPLSRVARRLNFFHGVAGKYNLDCPAGLPLGFDRYDRVAFPNRGRLEAYVAAGIVQPERAALVGFPKADALVAERGRRPRPEALGLDPGRPTVIFAPTFSPASALNLAGERIVDTLLAAGCNVIAKLHDRSFDPDPRYSGGVDWRRRLARDARGTFLLAEGGDSTPYVLASDVMVTDHSSVGFEFCALDRPVIVFDAPGLERAARINARKVALLRSAAAVVGDTHSLTAAVREALAAPQARSIERRRVLEEVFDSPGNATGRALALVYELLRLPPAPKAAAPATVLSEAHP